MSKHEKQVRRNRSKREAARQSRRNPKSKMRRHGVAALAAAGALAAGTQAYAAPMRFNNPAGPDHFDWKKAGSGDGDVLNILSGPGAQSGVATDPGTFLKLPDSYGMGELIAGHNTSGNSDHLLRVDIIAYFLLVGLDSGELIPPVTPPVPGAIFSDGGYAYTTTYGLSYYGEPPTLLAEGVRTYLALRFDLGAGDHYGWIGVVRNGQETDAFAWGYETEPGVPIPAGAPEPGSLALLAFGAAGTMARRRRPRN